MNDEAAPLARQVALEAYRRLADAVAQWNAYCAPHLEAPVVELLDGLVHRNSPQTLGDSVADLEVKLRRAVRRSIRSRIAVSTISGQFLGVDHWLARLRCRG
jgi:hypothetical protein